MNPFIELIKLKQQEAALVIAIKEKQQQAIEWHFSGDETKQLTGKVAEIDGASVTIKFVKAKPKPTPAIKEMLDRAAEIEAALKVANKLTITALESQISELTTNTESIMLKVEAEQLLSQIGCEVIPQIAITLPKSS